MPAVQALSGLVLSALLSTSPDAARAHYASTEAFLDIVELVIFHYNNYN